MPVSEYNNMSDLPDLDGDDPAKLSKKQISEIAEKINENAADGGACPVCKQNNWQIYPSLLTGTVFDVERDMHDHNRVVPLILTICSNCGNTNQFLAWHYGLKTKGGKKKSGQGKK